jgi:phospholipase/carboxylesterase
MAEMGGVLIHGRYRTPEEMVYLSSRLNLDMIRWIAPAAGHDRSWYPGLFMDPVSSNEPALTQAVKQIDNSLASASEDGRLGPGQLVMMGFSQGACLTVEYALRHPGRCRTLIVLTGGLFGPSGTKWPDSPTLLSGTRVLLTGSDVDEWIPEARVYETARVLTTLGAAVNVRIYHARPHEVSDAELAEASCLIKSD